MELSDNSNFQNSNFHYKNESFHWVGMHIKNVGPQTLPSILFNLIGSGI